MQAARRQSFKLILCGLTPRVRAIFEIAKLHTVFTIKGTLAEALAA
jgi:anti-anti-sigma regulatory factor